MLCRAAVLCGLDTTLSEAEISAILAGYQDSSQVSSWARAAVAYCLDQGILTIDSASQTLQPQTAILRSEIAQALYQLLLSAGLLV